MQKELWVKVLAPNMNQDTGIVFFVATCMQFYLRMALKQYKLSLDLWILYFFLNNLCDKMKIMHKHFCYNRLLWGKVLLWFSCQVNYLLFHGISFLFKRMTDKTFYRKSTEWACSFKYLLPIIILDLSSKNQNFRKPDSISLTAF